jgi:PEP-CTERM motif
MRTIGRAFVIAMVNLAAFGAVFLFSSSAKATFIETLKQQGADVVATGSGTIDLTDLVFLLGPTSNNPAIHPSSAYILTGAANSVFLYGDISGPTSFGIGASVSASSGSGDLVGIFGSATADVILVPSTYSSGSSLADTATFDSQTFASLGATPGTYIWTWGTGAHADSFKLQIGAVPEPSSALLLAVGLSAFAFIRRRRRVLAAA